MRIPYSRTGEGPGPLVEAPMATPIGSLEVTPYGTGLFCDRRGFIR